MKIELTDIQLSALREVGSIGAGHAATALSQIIKRRVDITVPDANILSLSEIPETVGGTNMLVVGIYMQVLGHVTGKIVVLIPRESALRLTDIMEGRSPGQAKVFSDVDLSKLNEVGNVISRSYLAALSKFLNAPLMPSVPHTTFDMLGSIVESLLEDITLSADLVLFIESELTEASNKLRLYLVLIPDSASFYTILKTLKV
jgi:chemotaxis protein CheC